MARDNLPAERRGHTIMVIGVTTAAGIGIGYPLVGLLAQGFGLYAPFWFVAVLSALALAAAMAVLPASPARPVRVDAGGAVLLGLGSEPMRRNRESRQQDTQRRCGQPVHTPSSGRREHARQV